MPGRRISYRLSLAVAIPLLVLITGGIVIAYSHGRAKQQIEQHTADLFQRVSTQAGDEAKAHLLAAAPIAELAARLMDEDAGDRIRLANRFVAFLRAHPELSWVSYSAEDGSFTGAFHSASGAFRTNLSQIAGGQTQLYEYDVADDGTWTEFRHEADTGYDPRTRPFYTLARERGARVFTEPYIFFEQGVPGITCALPHFGKHGVLRGVVTVDFDLNRLSQFVAGLHLSKRGEVFLFTPGADAERQIVVAHPTTRLVETSGQGAGGTLVSVADVEDPAVTALAAHAARGRRGFFSFAVPDGGDWYGSVTDIQIDDGLTWIVAAAAPQSDFTGALQRDLRTMLLVNVVVLAFAMLAAFFLASGVSRPLVRLAEQMGEIGQFQLDERPDDHSMFRELELMHEALARTKRGLRSFAAYVPRDLVRAVLASGKEAVLEGETRDLTIFFSDIAGFTTLAESRTPEQLVQILGGYLDDVTTVIAAHDGTVDKFLGDGVMAFWGAPAEKADHAALACEAAVRIQRKLTAGGAAGKSLATRIGLASGPVLVGNIGSHERMNYTVMGDVANLASRLEGLNKQYGTSIMIAESTARAAGDRIIARPVDVVAVKGKTEATRVYEILALAGDDDAPAARALARASAEALDRYLARDFAGGAAACDDALALRPDDVMLVRLRERCRTFVASPPSGDWTGVFHATDK